MLRPTRARLAGMSGIALATLLVLPAAAFAGSSGTIAQTGGMTATLPILGTSLSVGVTLDASGNLSQVNLDPVGTYTATALGAHAVTFATADGVTQVRIRASSSRLSIKAGSASLDNLLGSGAWSADVFGTKSKSIVGYRIGKASNGAPTVAIDSVSAAPGITSTTVPGKGTSDKKGARASAGVDFAMNGFVKHLLITVSVRPDGTHPATLSITLSGLDRQRLTGTLASLAGDHTWSGALCSGTAVSATVNVAADGTVTFKSATGAPATSAAFPGIGFSGDAGLHGWEHDGFGGMFPGDELAGLGGTLVSGVKVSFTGTGTMVAAAVLKLADGSYALSINGLGSHCGSMNGKPPIVNTPVSPTATATRPSRAFDGARIRLAQFGTRHHHRFGFGH